MVKFVVNGQEASSDQPADTPLLWVIRDELGLTGTKFGCGMAQCGACTVHLDGTPTRSCVTPVSARRPARRSRRSRACRPTADHPLQKAWIAEQVPQCGYCQSGQIMTAAALLEKNKNPTRRADHRRRMNGNICRCGTYNADRRRHPARGERTAESLGGAMNFEFRPRFASRIPRLERRGERCHRVWQF